MFGGWKHWCSYQPIYIILFVLLQSVCSKPEALTLTPSTQWYGNDGEWSAISVRVGTPAQWVDIIPSTISSETWVASPFGCVDSNALCASHRGGLFTPTTSTTWKSQGYYELNLNTHLGFQGYGDYGLDKLEFGTTGVALPITIIASVNETAYWVPYFGLGIVPGSFNGVTHKSVISGLVEDTGTIPSHSYGFTAGASYQQKTDPLSLTLGGYDSSRFIPHDISFDLNPIQQPQAYVKSISVVSSAASNNWTTATDLLNATDSVSAIIDSSTPFLWLPQSVCDQFAKALGLTYNDTLELYTYDHDASHRITLQNAQLNFTFGLSNLASSTDIVNISLPYDAFDLQVTYPYLNNTSYGDANSSKYYFPLKVAANKAQYTIGRAFLQEAYIITDYERNNFSVHQAIHTGNAIGDTKTVSIQRYSESQFSGTPKHRQTLSGGAVAGIIIGVLIFCALCAYVIFWVLRHRHRTTGDDYDEKPSEHNSPKHFWRRDGRHRDAEIHETNGNSHYANEVSADASHERFELPAPLGAAELESDCNMLSGTTENGSKHDAANLSAYEHTRTKLKHQQATSSQFGTQVFLGPGKSEQDTSSVAHLGQTSNSCDITPLRSSYQSQSTSYSLPGTTPGMMPQPSPPGYPGRRSEEMVNAGEIPYLVRLPSSIPSASDGDPLLSSHSSTPKMPLGPNSNNICESIYEARAPQDDLGSVSDNSQGLEVRQARQRGVDNMKLRKEDFVTMGAQEQQNHQDGGSGHQGQDDLVQAPQPSNNRYSWEVEGIRGEPPRDHRHE